MDTTSLAPNTPLSMTPMLLGANISTPSPSQNNPSSPSNINSNNGITVTHTSGTPLHFAFSTPLPTAVTPATTTTTTTTESTANVPNADFSFSHSSVPSTLVKDPEICGDWLIHWMDPSRRSLWKLSPPQFKACKKRKDCYNTAFEDTMYKAPYKYHLNFNIKNVHLAEDEQITAVMDLNYDDGSLVAYKSDKKKKENDQQESKRTSYISSGIVANNESTLNRSATDNSTYEVTIGPIQFNICSYKQDGRKFRILIFLISSVTNESVCVCISPPVLIRAKKPIANPGAKKTGIKKEEANSDEEANSQQSQLSKLNSTVGIKRARDEQKPVPTIAPTAVDFNQYLALASAVNNLPNYTNSTSSTAPPFPFSTPQNTMSVWGSNNQVFDLRQLSQQQQQQQQQQQFLQQQQQQIQMPYPYGLQEPSHASQKQPMSQLSIDTSKKLKTEQQDEPDSKRVKIDDLNILSPTSASMTTSAPSDFEALLQNMGYSNFFYEQQLQAYSNIQKMNNSSGSSMNSTSTRDEKSSTASSNPSQLLQQQQQQNMSGEEKVQAVTQLFRDSGDKERKQILVNIIESCFPHEKQFLFRKFFSNENSFAGFDYNLQTAGSSSSSSSGNFTDQTDQIFSMFFD